MLTGHWWEGSDFMVMLWWGTHADTALSSTQLQLWHILRWGRRKWCTYACTRRSRGSTGSHWALSIKQRQGQTLHHNDWQWNGSVCVYVCVHVSYHGSRHSHGRGFVIVANRHLRGEVLEKSKQRYKYFSPSVMWHITTRFKLSMTWMKCLLFWNNAF